jgi:hypothetical protein
MVEWSEDQILHLAVAYSNPFRWRTRRILMNDFRRRAANWPNVRLYVGELAYGDRPFEVTGDRSAVRRKRHPTADAPRAVAQGKQLNVTVSRFPSDWKYGGYSDADLVFTRQDWALEAIHQLRHYDLIQLFSSYMDLSAKHEPIGLAQAFAWNYQNQDAFLATGRCDTAPRSFPSGRIRAIGGELDINILGGGDSEMAHGLIGLIHELVARLTQPRATNASTRTIPTRCCWGRSGHRSCRRILATSSS